MSRSPPAQLRERWLSAVLLPGEADPRRSCLQELSEFTGRSEEEVIELCRGAVKAQRDLWHRADRSTPQGLIDFYDTAEAYLYELLWWHALQQGEAPAWGARLALIAGRHGAKRYLDFGGGIGTAAILLGREGVDVTVAEISGVLLKFARWRLERRAIPARFIDLKETGLEAEAYDLISAVDVLEHVHDPLATLQRLWAALRPGGLLVFDLIASPPDPERPFHLMRSKYPVRSRIRGMGFSRVESFEKFLVYSKTHRTAGASRLIGAWDRLRWRAYYLLQGKWPGVGC